MRLTWQERLDRPLANAVASRQLEDGMHVNRAIGGCCRPAHSDELLRDLSAGHGCTGNRPQRIEDAPDNERSFGYGPGVTCLDGDERSTRCKAEYADREDERGDEDFGECEGGAFLRAPT